MISNLVYSAEDRDAATCIFRLAGSLFGHSDGFAFQESVRSRICSGVTKIVLDLDRVDRIDSYGIGILAALTCSAQKNGAEVVLTALVPRIERILQSVGFEHWARNAETVPAALAVLDAPATIRRGGPIGGTEASNGGHAPTER